LVAHPLTQRWLDLSVRQLEELLPNRPMKWSSISWPEYDRRMARWTKEVDRAKERIARYEKELRPGLAGVTSVGVAA
jgi:hypothetical protein